jgi:hypothetical protein
MKNTFIWNDTPCGRIDVSKERVASIIKVTGIEELGITRRHVPRGFTPQKTAFFIIIAVKTSDLSKHNNMFTHLSRFQT